jgi:hypothetical protein
MSTDLNYDPSDPDKMRLPIGATCGDCRHIGRCKAMFDHTETDSYCDWSPSRFARSNLPHDRTSGDA